MPIFVKNGKRVLFAHIPKTGGTSIIAMAKDNGWKVEHGREQHATMRVYRDWDYDRAFSVVREPVERMKSFLAWRHIRLEKSDDFLGGGFRTHRHMTHEKLQQELLEREQLGWVNGYGPCIMPQTWFVAHDCEWARYGEEAPLLEKMLGTSEREKKNVSTWPKADLKPETVELIRDFYAEDYSRFGFPAAE